MSGTVARKSATVAVRRTHTDRVDDFLWSGLRHPAAQPRKFVVPSEHHVTQWIAITTNELQPPGGTRLSEIG